MLIGSNMNLFTGHMSAFKGLSDFHKRVKFFGTNGLVGYDSKPVNYLTAFDPTFNISSEMKAIFKEQMKK